MNTYVGMDVAKQFFDRYDLATEKHQRFDHTAVGISACITSLTACTPALIVMESTGGYETNLAVAYENRPQNALYHNLFSCANVVYRGR